MNQLLTHYLLNNRQKHFLNKNLVKYTLKPKHDQVLMWNQTYCTKNWQQKVEDEIKPLQLVGQQPFSSNDKFLQCYTISRSFQRTFLTTVCFTNVWHWFMSNNTIDTISVPSEHVIKECFDL